MLTIKQITDDKEHAIARLKVRGIDARATIELIEELDEKRRKLQTMHDSILSEQNAIAKQIGQLIGQGKKEEAEEAKSNTTKLKEQSRFLEEELRGVIERLNEEIVSLPNLPNKIVPKGKSAEDNEVVKTVGKIPTLAKDALPHWELAKRYDIIDFELGVKLTGAGFPVYKGQGAALQRALITMFLEMNIAAGYKEVMPPLMVNETSGFGTGQLPDKEGQMYHVGIDNFYLIPTAEVPVTNIYRDEIVELADLPIQLTAYTPCFRREAGSYGKEVRGLNRLHQFDKVEIVRIEHPDRSYTALDQMVAHVEGIVQALELPYRILRLSGGDMGFTSALTYDFEVYSAAQQRWLEVSSVSNFETFQANRLKLRYRDEEKKMQIAHTLNGSALALPRIVAALLENNQSEKGIKIPAALAKYTRFDMIK